MNLLPVFQWVEGSGLGRVVRETVWAFAVIESLHLLALALMGGAVLLVDLRLLNLGMRQRSVPEVAREAQPFMGTALVALIVSGVALFASEAVKCYYSYPFWVKMTALVLAIAFAFGVRNRVALADEGRFANGTRMLVALVSVMLWFVVAASGRWIGFSG